MSLWKVDDEATRDLMVGFYRNLSAGQGRAEALRGAQLAMLKTPALSHPFYWASFIPSGDWRELRLPPAPAAPLKAKAATQAPAPPPTSPGARGCGCSVPGLRSDTNGAASLILFAFGLAAAAASRSRRP